MNKNPVVNLFYRILIPLFFVMLLLGVSPYQGGRAATTVRYVKPAGLTTGACDTWENACDFQFVLGLAISGDEVWVAQGTYYPTNDSDRSATFLLKTGVSVYGGFDGSETSREERDWVIHITTLSGDIGVKGNNSDNSYHVVTGSGTDGTAILDGFTITGGNANTNYQPYNTGGGMYNNSGNPRVANVVFDGNSAALRGGGVYNYYSDPSLANITFISNTSDYGGGMLNYHSSPSMANVTFNGNSAIIQGGGMYNYYYSTTMANVTFNGNSAINQGGGMYDYLSSPTLVNVTFNSNTAGNQGGGIYNQESNPIVYNNILWGNNPDQIFNDANSNTTISYSDLQGVCPTSSDCTTHVIYTDPRFVNAAAGNLRLSGTSPAIDAGDNTRVPAGILYDLAGNPRFIDIPEIPDTGNGVPPIVDMGAYEHQVLIAVDDSYTTDEDIQLVVPAPGVLGNDIDLNGNALTAVLDDGPAHGLLTLNSDGSFVYSPTLSYHGTDSFTYHAYDGELNSNIATVTITVIHTIHGTTTTVNCGSGTPVVTYGSSITCVATVTRAAGNLNPTGTVSWTTGGTGSFATSPCTLSGSGGTATCSVSYTPSARGSGSHLITATYGGDSNFTGSSGNQTVTVNHRPITVTADAKTKVVSQPDPVLTYQITSGSLVFGDAFTGALTRVSGENVGPHAILQGTLALNDNYTLTYIGANLTITNLLVFLPIISG